MQHRIAGNSDMGGEGHSAPLQFVSEYVAQRHKTVEECLEEALRENAELKSALASATQRIVELEKRIVGMLRLQDDMAARIYCLEQGLRAHIADKPRIETGQLDLSLPLPALVAQQEALAASETQGSETPAAKSKNTTPGKRHKHGRRRTTPAIERTELTVFPLGAVAEGLQHFKIIGEEKTVRIFKRRGGCVELTTIRPNVVRIVPERDGNLAKTAADCDRPSEHQLLEVPVSPDFRHNPYPDGALIRYQSATSEGHDDDATVLTAFAEDAPLPRCLADASLLAYLVVNKMDLHLPYYRQVRILERMDVPLHRNNMVRWHFELGAVVQPIYEAMWNDALKRAWIATDATNTAIFEKDKYRNAHIFVLVAPQDGILYRFESKYNAETMRAMFGDYVGVIVADASKNHDTLFGPGKATEAACFAHFRRYLVKAMRNGFSRQCAEPFRWVNELFAIERDIAHLTVREVSAARQAHSAPIVEKIFAWIREHNTSDLPQTSFRKALIYGTNQEQGLREFLRNPNIPIHNNASERALRRVVKGRVNWLFMGSDEHARRSCYLYSLVASCEMHGLDPEFYLQEVFTVAPHWPRSRMLELSPKHWVATRARLIQEGRLRYIDIRRLLAARSAVSGLR